jgi:nitrate/nitrite transporter NarK
MASLLTLRVRRGHLRLRTHVLSAPHLLLSESAAAAAVGIVNVAVGFGGFVGPMAVGKLLQLGHPFSVAIKFLAASFFLGGALCFCIRNHIKVLERRTYEPAT